MARISVVLFVVSVVGLVGVIQGPAILAEQAPLPLAGQAIPRCDIPRAFGRLVTFLPGDETGLKGQATAESANGNVLAGQAIFEATDG